MGKRNKLKQMLSPPSSTPPPKGNADDELMDELLNELDSRNQTVKSEASTVLSEMQQNRAEQIEASPKQDSKSRFQARAARKAAALAGSHAPNNAEADAKLERQAKEEERNIQLICDKVGVEIYEINPDGHCLFSAIADQLALLGLISPAAATYATTRQAAAYYMFTHPDDFLPFLPSVEGEDGTGATANTGLMSPRAFERYCATIRDTGAWGGEPEILALSRAYNVPIHVVQSESPGVVIHDPVGGDVQDKSAARISYHRYMYGLGEHYNSLRPKRDALSQISQKLQSMI